MTELLRGPEGLDEAASRLARGEVVGVPTDTVYGLAARLTPDALDALFVAKGRPAEVPVAVLCATVAAAAALARPFDATAAALADAFWPGPLTLVVASDPALSSLVRSPRGVGVRVPDDAACQALLARTGPLAVTSANRHGEPPATTAEALVASLGGRVAAAYDDGLRGGAVSTVVDLCDEAPRVLRVGALDPTAVSDVLSEATGGPTRP